MLIYKHLLFLFGGVEMIVYFLLTILVFIQMYFAEREKNNNNKIISYILIATSIITLALPSALRKSIGTDYYGYVSIFNIVGTEFNPLEREITPFFNMLVAVIKRFTNNPQWLFVVTSFVFSTFSILSITRMSNHWGLSSALLILGCFYNWSFSNIRQACALSLSMYAFSYFYEHKFLRGFVLYLLSFGFHSSAIFIAPIMILSCFTGLKKYGLIFVLIVLLMIPFCLNVLIFAKEKLHYKGYFEIIKSPYIFEFILGFGIILFVSCFYYNRIYQDDNYTFGLIITFAFAFVFSMLSNHITAESTIRTTFWFSWPLIFLIPRMLKINDNKIISYSITVLLIITITTLTLNRAYFAGWYETFPYIDIWGHMIY